jgi:hypothetical protein
MNDLRRAIRDSALVRLAVTFVGIALIGDAFLSATTGRFGLFLTPFALVYAAIVLVGFSQRARWARDPVIPTIGRSPTDQDVGTAKGARVTSRTERLPLDALSRDTLMSDARRRSREGRAAVIVGSSFALGAALFVAVQGDEALLFAAAILIVILPAAFLFVLAGPPRSADTEWGELYRTEGRVHLSWVLSRGGRYWDVRAGDRTLHVWDEVGSKLANMPWGVLEYTTSGVILRLRDIDGNSVYELAVPPDAWITRNWPRMCLVFLAIWGFLAVLVRVVSNGSRY